MGLIKWGEKNMKKLKFWDIGVFKLCLLVLGMIIGAYLADFVKQHVWWFVVVFVLTYLWLIYKIFKK